MFYYYILYVSYKIYRKLSIGFNNINVDLMYAIGDEKFDELKQDIEEYKSLAMVSEEQANYKIIGFKIYYRKIIQVLILFNWLILIC